MTSNSVDPWPALMASDWSRPLIGQLNLLLLASTNCHGLQDLFGKEKEVSILYIVSVSVQEPKILRLATCRELFVSEEIIILLVLMSSNQTYRRL